MKISGRQVYQISIDLSMYMLLFTVALLVRIIVASQIVFHH